MAAITKTFKQFIQENTIDDLEFELFVRREIGTSRDAARTIRQWYQSNDRRAPTENTWAHLIDWAAVQYKADTGRDLYSLVKGAVSMPMLVRGILARRLRKLTLKEDILDELPFMLALRKEYGMSKEQAEEVIAWFKGEKDWDDLEHDARGVFIGIWDPDTPDLHHVSMLYGDFVMDEVHEAMKKYNIDTRDFG